jgi:hypothetical protein
LILKLPLLAIRPPTLATRLPILAIRAAALRDEAGKSLADWRSRFNTTAAIATRDRPDLSAKLGL